uniref:Branched-chain amino acid transport system ATP-binding protein n=1 Tax=Candidatus Kentrum sp. TC TaxID=2126339 RepID=A0A451A1L1_9GAMM|nr:MAG: branched-chain amino acid transport system ATP-binding protein [Candidatus Kentron sp. TC]
MTLSVGNLARHFGAVPILEGVELKLHPNTLTLLTGRNGSGKSTLVNCVTGFDRHYQGCVAIGPQRMDKYGPEVRARRGLVRTFQYPHLFPSMAVRENIAIGYCAKRFSLDSYFHRFSNLVDAGGSLTNLGLRPLEKRKADALSFGEMKLVNLARALTNGPRYLLLDEPLASLHGERREAVVSAIVDCKKQGAGILVIEHRVPDLIPHADAALELRDGRLFPRDTR